MREAFTIRRNREIAPGNPISDRKAVRARRGNEERWHQVYNPPAHTRSVACARGSVWQVRCQQWLLVHVLEARRRLSGGAARGKQRGVTADRRAWLSAGLARVRWRIASGLVPAHAPRCAPVA